MMEVTAYSFATGRNETFRLIATPTHWPNMFALAGEQRPELTSRQLLAQTLRRKNGMAALYDYLNQAH